MNSKILVDRTDTEAKPVTAESQQGHSAAAVEPLGDSIARTRILLLTDSFLPHAGGSREYYYNIYRELVALGKAHVTVLTKKVEGWEQFDQKANASDFRILRRFNPLPNLRLKELPKGLLPFLQTLWHVIWKPPEIIHAGDLYPQGLTAYFMKKVFGIPYVAYCHGEEVTQMDRYRYQPLMRDLIYRSADAVVANSDFACKLLSRIGVASKKIHKINPGVDVARFMPAARNQELSRRYNLEGKLVILTVGRLVPRKGHQAALRAFAQVSEEFSNAHYLIAGTGPEEARLKQFVSENGLGGRVTFAGFVPGYKLPEFYNLCDFMLLANREETNGDVEGFGMVFLEANAAGKAVIGGRNGGAVEAVQDGVTGLLVNPDNELELVAALRQLLSDSELRDRLGKAGLQRARSEFHWRSKAMKLCDVNLQIMCPGKASGGSAKEPCKANPGRSGDTAPLERIAPDLPTANHIK